MKPQFKLALGIAALALAGLATGQASAGNLSAPSAQYFSLDIPAGYRVTYTGPNPTQVTLLVDDLSFSGTIDPCDPVQKCRYFPRGVMAPYYTPDQGGTNPGASNSPPFVVYTYSEARGTDYAIAVIEGGPTIAPQEFDRMSHSTHAELYAVSTVASQDNGGEPLQRDPDNLIDWELMGVAMSSWATPTSQSRHYQTPQIIQPEHWIDVKTVNLGSGYYGNPYVKIKGRLITSLLSAPVEVTTFTISTIP